MLLLGQKNEEPVVTFSRQLRTSCSTRCQLMTEFLWLFIRIAMELITRGQTMSMLVIVIIRGTLMLPMRIKWRLGSLDSR